MRQIALMRQSLILVCLCLALLSGCRKKKYENPITKDTQQPDKVLFDKAVGDIERGRYEVARLTLQTLINTYDTSEYLAKAKLAIADSWFREGGTNGMAQAEAEYKDFILFYPTMEESAESQEKICMIHYRQMEKPDRDANQAQRAEEECRQVLQQFPNSKFAPRVAQLLRNIQEAIAEGEFRVGAFYHKKGSYPAAANRLQTLTDHYPIYSQADEALFQLGDSYGKMGSRFRERSGQAYARIVKEYPLSPRAEEARNLLKQMEMPVPEADPAAAARMKYELENRTKAGMMDKSMGFLKRGPDTRMAAKSGEPAMTPMRPSIPVSVPVAAPAAVGGVTDVTAEQVGNSSALDTNPDARQIQPAPGASPGTAAAAEPGAATPETSTAAPAANSNEPLPSNRQAPPGKKKKESKPKAPKKK
jgi:outer membrane protein assembly factor BamD